MLVVLILLGLVEILLHRRVLRQLPIRIHVNGTRGKTSVVRLITAGLHAGGKRVCSKTTGSFAAVTGPDGEDYPLHRPNQPNIIEQMRVMRRVVAFRPEVVVMECMALQPHFQALTERQMVRSTHGVITNARADHLDVMGPQASDVALALAGTVPFGADLFTAEREFLDTFRMAAEDRGSSLHATTAEDVAAVTDDEMAGFRYAEHAENVALALNVCEALGVDRAAALKGMQGLAPEVGATRVQSVDFFGRDIIFVNAFAANDPDSTELIWEKVIDHYGENRFKLAVVNCRFDRPQRSQQLAEVAGRWTPADHYVLMGSGTLLFARAAVHAGLRPSRMTVAEGLDQHELFETVIEHTEGAALIVGMCNVHGGGAELARQFNNRATRSQPL
ncbi:MULTISPECIES: poly-gamma-glutamate synthase PgsB [unclassified Wenzhouxiangella]|uniref:poly-gamma-glutamate synthase PgsB n=1 Tax=unclassified Wenzhouxiangella TaxID=2613841 RepID=UPI0021614AED|nr:MULTISPECIES: poly-gamma-glutamate synthase PgsB [unclassified Wenzhouxiangella]